ncbi:Hypothetical predicted protein [Mytilus galloprovincialis]|uniref:Integrase catalytic domain-containing protein n=1 Tax=Mytilus galloprovincialis TaxID=29158 RepID=A0A8B6DWZ5_MYTGA|nr:Hypothetical predicted protein [Mytilus galloprovincialis]
MSSSAFINAVRRFAAIRGQVKIFRSDRGTNFIGAIDDLKIDSINVEDGPFKNFLYNSGTTWIFNPPHSSHMGGAWERMIGITRRILDSMLLNAAGRSLTHDVLNTLMAEVSAIVNSRPLVPVSTDPENPLILTYVITQKTTPSCSSTLPAVVAIKIPIGLDPNATLYNPSFVNPIDRICCAPRSFPSGLKSALSALKTAI